jgi:hypothetical protein
MKNRKVNYLHLVSNQKGQILVFAIGILLVIIIMTVLLISNAFTYSASSKYSTESLQAMNLAEAGIDRAVAALNKTAGNYNGESETILGNGSYSVTVTSIDGSNKIVEATGYIPNKTNPKSKRTIKIQISKGEGIAFNYGVQVGNGGFELRNTARVNGSVYSNGNITMENGSRITGDVFIAGGVQPTPNQEWECSPLNCVDFVFGRNVGGQNQLDIAQGFQPTQTAVINKVALKLKKIGSPPDAIVRILANNAITNTPNKNEVLASGALYASLATNEYSYIEVAFTTTPQLLADTTYWLVIDTSSNNTNYWNWSLDSGNGYTRGVSKWSPNWNASNPVWNNIAGDLAFKTYIGGTATYIQGQNNAVVEGNVHANTIRDLTINKDAYYQIIQNTTAANYYPTTTDPASKVLPISEANITEWKGYAEDEGVFTGNITQCPATLGPGKIIGDVTLINQCIYTVQTPIWITGNLLLDNGSIGTLASSYGATSGAIIVDGTVKLSNNSQLRGTGTGGSYMMVLSTYDSRTSGITAIESDNGSASTVLYANNGIILLKNNAALSEITAWKVALDNGASINYSSGLADLFFTSGETGGFSVVKGTYQVK